MEAEDDKDADASGPENASASIHVDMPVLRIRVPSQHKVSKILPLNTPYFKPRSNHTRPPWSNQFRRRLRLCQMTDMILQVGRVVKEVMMNC